MITRPMKRLRVGILDFFDIQKAQSKMETMSRAVKMVKKRPKGFSLLFNAVKKTGHIPILYRPEHCQMLFDHDRAAIFYKGKKIKGCDVLIPRINAIPNLELEISIIKQFQLMGIPVVNDYLSITRALNKLMTLQILTKNGIKVPKTIIVRKFEYLDQAIDLLGGYPVIIKSVFGNHGKGVALIESRRSLYSALDILWGFGGSIVLLIQEYIAEAESADYCAFVIGDKIVASMKRTAPHDDFRTNLILGGNAQKVDLSKEEKELALKVKNSLGLNICSIDFFRTPNGPVVTKVNPSSGLVSMSQVTAIDIPAQIINYAIGLAQKKLPKVNFKTKKLTLVS
jgi:ribosomal protein S6--L-glutamate ligase